MAGKKADYQIVAELVLLDKTKPVRVRIDRQFNDTFNRIENRARQAGSSIGRSLMRGLVALGTGHLIARATRGIVGMHTEIETAQTGLASLFTAFTGAPIEQSLARASAAIRVLRRDAASGVGELSHYADAFQRIFAVTRGAVSDSVVRELTRNTLAAGFAIRGPEGLHLAPMDIQQALTGNLSERMTPIAMQAIRAAGLSAEEFRGLDFVQKIEALNRGFATFEKGVKLMGQTWEAQTSTMRDNIKEILRTATEPVFERWKARLTEANQWLERNSDRMQEMATVWGERLLSVWEHVVNNTRTYVSLLAAAAAIQAAPGWVGKAATTNPLNWPTMLAQAGGLHGPLNRKGRFGFGELFGTTTGLGAMARGAGLTKLLKGGGILGLVALAIEGVIAAWTEFPQVAGFVTTAWVQLTDAFGQLIDSLSSWTGDGSILNKVGAGILVVGGALLHFVGILFRVAATIGHIIGGVAQIAGSHPLAAPALLKQMRKDIADIWDFSTPSPQRKAAEEAAEEAAAGPGAVTNNVINFNNTRIEVKSEVNADPARVAVAFEEIVNTGLRFPMGARRLPTFG